MKALDVNSTYVIQIYSHFYAGFKYGQISDLKNCR